MSRAKTIAITVGSLTAGALLATGVTGIAAAANGTPSPGASNGSAGSSQSAPKASSLNGAKGGQQGLGGPGRGDHGPRGGMLGGPGGQPLHGEIVVKKTDGTIATVRMIDGTVTAVSSDSITVKAADDFTATYTVNSSTDVHVGLPGPRHDASGADGSTSSATKPAASTIADVKVGDVARVEGTVSGSTATATEIHAMTAAQAAQLDELRKQHDAQRGSSTTGSSSTSSSSSSAA